MHIWEFEMKNLNLSSVNFITILVEFCPFFFFKDFHLSPFFCVFWMNHVSPFLFACQFFVYCLFILLILGILSVLLFFFWFIASFVLHACVLLIVWDVRCYIVFYLSFFIILCDWGIWEWANSNSYRSMMINYLHTLIWHLEQWILSSLKMTNQSIAISLYIRLFCFYFFWVFVFLMKESKRIYYF